MGIILSRYLDSPLPLADVLAWSAIQIYKSFQLTIRIVMLKWPNAAQNQRDTYIDELAVV